MLTPSDGSSDGGKLAYLQQADRYRQFDPALFDILGHASAEPDRRRLQAIEESDTVTGASYFNEMLADDRIARAEFMERCSAQFRSADLIFFDPDNGLEVTLPKGRKNSSKYLYFDEVAGFYDDGKSVLVYQHFPRIERSTFIAHRTKQLRSAAKDCAIWAFTTAHVVFFLVIHPESPARLVIAALEASAHWEPAFVHGEHISTANN